MSETINQSDIQVRAKKVIAEKLGKAEADIESDAHLINNLGADSLDTVELVMALEEEFRIEISDDDAEKIQTVQDILDYIEKCLILDKRT